MNEILFTQIYDVYVHSARMKRMNDLSTDTLRIREDKEKDRDRLVFVIWFAPYTTV